MHPDTVEMMRVNERNWDARTPVHAGSEFYDLAGLRDSAERLAPFEYDELGALAGRDVVHLQCHIGTDTVCLSRNGAHVVGVDLSTAAVARAREIATDCGVVVEYEQANVYDAADVLGGRTFDLVYTGKGSLCWLPDLNRWARVVHDLLRPGGELYLVEFHPFLATLADDQPGEGLSVTHDYLAKPDADRCEDTHTYTDGDPLAEHTVNYQWLHDLGSVVNALTAVGLRVSSLVEHDALPWGLFPDMVAAGNGWWRLPTSKPRVPLLYSLRAVRD